MEDIYSIIIMLISGYLIRYALIFSGQLWAKSFAQTVSFFILPIITFVITKTIYGNIALSLGMIGALSIVRFRHPVKSALELIIYFDLITIGIAASVKNNYAILLSLITVIILISLKPFSNSSKAPVRFEAKNIRLSAGAKTTPRVGIPFSMRPRFTVNEPSPSFFRNSITQTIF